MAKSDQTGYIVGSRGASQLGGSLIGIPLGYKASIWPRYDDDDARRH